MVQFKLYRRLGDPKIANIVIVASTQLVSMASIPVIARQYTPEQYGHFALIQITALLLSTLMTCRLELAIPLLKRREHYASLFLTIVGVLLAMLGVIMVIYAFLWMIDAQYYVSVLQWAIPLAVGMVFTNISTMTLTWKRRYILSVFLNLCLAIVILGSQWILAFSGRYLATHGLENGATIGYVTLGLISLRICLTYVDKWHVPCNEILYNLRKNKDILFYTTGSSLLYFISSNWPIIMLGKFYGPVDVGLFAMGKKIIDAGSRLIDGSYRNIVYGEYSCTRDAKKFIDLARKNIIFVVLLGGISAIIVSFIGKQVILAVLGGKWAGLDIIILCLLPLFIGVSGTVVHKAVIIAERQNRFLFVIDLAMFLLRPAAIVISAYVFVFSANISVLFFSFTTIVPVVLLSIKLKLILSQR